jgi:fucose 4-O-acetylase-like acetyltransferase
MDMQIAEITEDIALMLPILILAQSVIALVAWFAFGAKGGRGARFAAWLGLVTLTLWVGSGLAFVVLHILLFSLGNEAVVAGVAVTTVFMLLMPFGWAWVIRQRGGDESGSPSPAGPTGSQPR